MSYAALAAELIRRDALTRQEREWLETAHMSDDRIAVLHTQREMHGWRSSTHLVQAFEDFKRNPNKSADVAPLKRRDG